MIIVRPERSLAAAAFVVGSVVWAIYYQQELVLSHYDAKAHLVVARRVIDSLTPGWQQFGAVWLPLPHLIQALPVQVDLLYRTGASGSFVSLLSFVAIVWAGSGLVRLATGSTAGALTAAALLLFNPNLLYLQATPMTEPLLLALVLVSVRWAYEWLMQSPAQPRPPRRLLAALFAAMWTRYEAWPIVVSLIGITAIALRQQGLPAATLVRRVRPLAGWPLLAVALFLVNSRITVGAWFVTGGFYVPDPFYEGHLWRSVVAVWWGTHQLGGYVAAGIALATAASLIAGVVTRRVRVIEALPLALLAAGALPVYAFYEGHPFRIRYMVTTTAAAAVLCGLAVGAIVRFVERRGTRPDAGHASLSRSPAALAHVARLCLPVLVVGAALIEAPPLDPRAPVVQEAQWDLPRSRERRRVTECLASRYRGEKVMASMGSLAHYMQELAGAGFALRDFLHEGNGVIWELAMMTGPAPHAGWMLVEEEAEGGDVLAQRLRADAAFAGGMSRVCEAGGVALYERTRQ